MLFVPTRAFPERNSEADLAANNLDVIYSRDPDKLINARKLAYRFRGT